MARRAPLPLVSVLLMLPLVNSQSLILRMTSAELDWKPCSGRFVPRSSFMPRYVHFYQAERKRLTSNRATCLSRPPDFFEIFFPLPPPGNHLKTARNFTLLKIHSISSPPSFPPKKMKTPSQKPSPHFKTMPLRWSLLVECFSTSSHSILTRTCSLNATLTFMILSRRVKISSWTARRLVTWK